MGSARAAEIDEQIRSYLEDCAQEATELRPADCALEHDPGHYFPLRGDAVWEVESLPEVRLDATGTVNEPGRPTVTVSTVEPGRASVTYAILQEEERTVGVDIEADGDVRLDESGSLVWRL